MIPSDQGERDLATDVTRSVIVQAPAGSGKTTLLVHRYLKLLAGVREPEEILAITFTIKAAGEMRTRVMEAMRSNDPIARAALQRSAELGWDLLQQPKRLKIQTIDSFAMSLARQLPLQSGFNPDTALTEFAEELYTEAADAVLLRLYSNDPFEQEIADFLSQCGNEQSRARRLLALMLSKRDQWLGVVHAVMHAYQSDPESLPATLNDGSTQLTETIVETFAGALAEPELSALLDLLDHAAENLDRHPQDDADRLRMLGELLTTGQGALRKQVTKREGFPPEQPQQKAEIMSIIAALSQRGMDTLAANLRFIPNPPESTVLDRLVAACISLTLAVVELKKVFDRHQTCDFTELLLAAQAALGDGQAPSELALALDHRIAHVLVDEFQDTAVSQFHLFEQLLEGWSLEDGNTFFAVGDPMQSIYRFRDADVGLFYLAQTRGIASIPLEPVSLQSNFRSTPELVNWCNNTFADVLGNLQDPVLGAIPFSASQATVSHVADSHAEIALSDSEVLQCRQIGDRIDTLLADDDHSTIAILVRTRGQLLPLLAELKQRGIDWHASDIDPLTNKPVVLDLLACARLLADPTDRLALFSVLRAPFCGLLLPDLELLAPVPELLAGDIEYPPELSADGLQRLQRLQRVWQSCLRLQDEVPPRTLLETFWLQMGGTDAYPDAAALDHADRFLQLVDRHCPDVLESLILQRAAEKLFANDLNQSRLQIMTIHKAKGLEFDHVILPFLEKTTRADEPGMLLWRALPEGLLLGCRDDGGVYDWLIRENKAREQHERERLLYVACTRARTTLQLYATPGDKPPPRSLLSLLWPEIERRLERGDLTIGSAPEGVKRDSGDDPVTPAAGDPTTRPRLKSGYSWQAPESSPHYGQRSPGTPDLHDELSEQLQVAIGIIVHRELELLAQRDLPEVAFWRSARESFWLRQAAALGVAATERAQLLDQVAQQLERVLGDQQGRWLLSARDDAHAELALSFVPEPTAIDGPDIVHLVLDRTFRADGFRWVIDYKTALPQPDEDRESFIQAQISRYRGQLQRYAEAVSLVYEEPVQVAVYFTALPQLELIS